MKNIVYITRGKIWAGDTAYDWDGKNMEVVWGRIKKEQRISDARVILGNDVSFVTSTKADETVVNRADALRIARSWLPFEIDDECFDWKEVELVPGEKWLQLVAVQKEFLLSLSSAVKKNGIKVDMVTAVGVLLAEKTSDREVPVILKWSGKEELLIVAVKGLADLVVSDVREDDLMVYTKQKWGLAVNPEELVFSDAETDLVDLVYAERVKGDDRIVLNLPLLRDVVVLPAENNEEMESVTEQTKQPKRKRFVWVYLIGFLVMVTGLGWWLWKNEILSFITKPTSEPTGVEVTVTQAPTASPTAEIVDLTKYSVEVLNGSGVTGEAARVKDVLISAGFTSVDIGNTTATIESQLKTKTDMPAEVSDMVIKSIENYKLELTDSLTDEEKHDLIIVLGK